MWKCTAKNYLKGQKYEDSVIANFEAGKAYFLLDTSVHVCTTKNSHCCFY